MLKELLFILCILVSIAFVTVLERKVLAKVQIRNGPNKVSVGGLFQSFADVVKLFGKNFYWGESVEWLIYSLSSCLAVFIMLCFWITIPSYLVSNEPSSCVLFFLVCLSFNVYPVIFSSWSSNCKYSLISCYRNLSQTVSYELSLTAVLTGLLFLSGVLEVSFNFSGTPMFFYLYPLIFFMWLLCSLMELNRTPFDFSEGESELVSGHLSEYGGFLFSFFFLAEYGMILFFGVLTSWLFFYCLEFFIVYAFLIIWIRGVLPRDRYDKLMDMSWKSVLPLSVLLMMTGFLFWFFGYNQIDKLV